VRERDDGRLHENRIEFIIDLLSRLQFFVLVEDEACSYAAPRRNHYHIFDDNRIERVWPDQWRQFLILLHLKWREEDDAVGM
jgi:hypothetical protein